MAKGVASESKIYLRWSDPNTMRNSYAHVLRYVSAEFDASKQIQVLAPILAQKTGKGGKFNNRFSTRKTYFIY